MGNVESLLTGFAGALTLTNLMFGLLGTILGTLVGVLPGIGPDRKSTRLNSSHT